MENAIDVDVANVNLNKENTSSTTVGVDGVENAEGSEGGGDLAKKRKRTSQVWSEFKIVTLPDKSEKAECIHCKGRFALI